MASRVHPRPNRKADRRLEILGALDKCIRQKGVAGATLTDIAVAAQMSLSHVQYYFQTKEDILKHYLSTLSEEILAEIEAIEQNDPEQWLDKFTAYFVANPRVRTSIGVVIEIFGVSVHHPDMARIKAEHDLAIRQILRGFFEWAGLAQGITLKDATYTAWALESGMKFNSAFQRDYSPRQAAKVFKAEMRRLAGLPLPRRSDLAASKGRRRSGAA